MKTVLLTLLLSVPLSLSAQKNAAPLDSSRTTFSIFLRDGGQYVGRIISRDSLKVVVRRQGGGLSYLAPADITRIEPYQSAVRNRGRNLYAVTLTDGTIYTGQIRERTESRVVIRRRGGESILSPAEITRIEPLSETAPADVVIPTAGEPNQNPSARGENAYPWLLNSQTAIPLKAGQATYRNIWVLYNEVAVGLFNFLTLRASVTPSFGGSTFYNSTLYTRPAAGLKLSIPLGSVHLGGTLDYQFFEGWRYAQFSSRRTYRRQRTLGGMVTFGGTSRNLTLGYTSVKADIGEADRRSLDIGFVAPLGRRVSLICDNRVLLTRESYWDGHFSQVSAVFRLNRARHAFDLGALIPIRDEDRLRVFPLPYLGYNLRLSRR
ncbi:hypothetical protein F5984_09385 [Rudanella paleaurantiibacter]|uniref:DUF481 domain-containing protein n=1 Tax=Rudanella paleaurantiibacter TaxID=2614655 RepID=A0A7J5TZW0_9BACT|nr:hypothetical protein [Rudanella paleaurantiibacter]KAB7731028.1 hypothetical protein F5984_09385 [Rudanella paleaurantiibacter]